MVDRVSVATMKLPQMPHALYRFFDRTDALLYIGISVNLPARLRQHRSDKAWWLAISRVQVEYFPIRRAALDAEKHAIETEGPLFNDTHNDLALVESSFDDLNTEEKIRRLHPVERNIIAAPAHEQGHEQGMHALAEHILEYVYDPGDMPGIRRRAEWQGDAVSSDDTVNLAVAAMEQAADHRTSLENALENLLYAFPENEREADFEAARQDVIEFMGSQHDNIDVLCRAVRRGSLKTESMPPTSGFFPTTSRSNGSHAPLAPTTTRRGHLATTSGRGPCGWRRDTGRPAVSCTACVTPTLGAGPSVHSGLRGAYGLSTALTAFRGEP